MMMMMMMMMTIDVLSSWMASNRLLLNPSKTQLIWLGGRRQLQGIDFSQLTLLFPHITFSVTVRDLGLTLDSDLTLSQHVNLVARIVIISIVSFEWSLALSLSLSRFG